MAVEQNSTTAARAPDPVASAEGPHRVRGGMVRLGTFTRYEEAQEVVDRLSDAGFEVKSTAIVAEGLRMYEQVTGRQSWFRSASSGALQGLLVGLFVALLFAILSLAAPAMAVFNVMLWGAGIGLIVGACMGLIAYAATGGKRDFTSVSGIQADSYTVLVENDFADQAKQLLGLPLDSRSEAAGAAVSL